MQAGRARLRRHFWTARLNLSEFELGEKPLSVHLPSFLGIVARLQLEEFTPQPATLSNRLPCSNSTDTGFDDKFLRIKL